LIAQQLMRGIMIGPGTVALTANPSKFLANTPVPLQRFQRLVSLLRGPFSLGGLRHFNPLGLTNTISLKTRLSSTRGLPLLFGKYGPRRSICSSVSRKKAHCNPLEMERVIHLAKVIASRGMGPEPKAI
jgi:hypothetical protein